MGMAVSTLEGHTDCVEAVACFTLPDGSVRAISGSIDKTLRVWDPIVGTCLATLAGHASYVRAVSGSKDDTLRVWDPIAGTCLATLEGHTDCVLAVACFTLPDGSVRAISAFADKLRVWVVPAEKAAARLLRLPSPAEGG